MRKSCRRCRVWLYTPYRPAWPSLFDTSMQPHPESNQRRDRGRRSGIRGRGLYHTCYERQPAADVESGANICPSTSSSAPYTRPFPRVQSVASRGTLAVGGLDILSLSYKTGLVDLGRLTQGRYPKCVHCHAMQCTACMHALRGSCIKLHFRQRFM